MGLRAQVATLPRWLIFVIGYAALAIIFYFDMITGPDFSMALFYLAPIYFVTWYAGTQPGLLISLLSMLAMVVGDVNFSHPVRLAAFMNWDRFARYCFILITAVLLGRLREAYRVARETSRVDFLTGLANRREFFAEAEQERLRAARYGQKLSVAYIDLDGFKEVNDRLGHSAGDTVLIDIAQVLRNNVRSTDLVARMGGDEFVLLLPETDAAAARVVVEKLRLLLGTVSNERHWGVSCSIGLVTFEDAPKSTDEMLSEADRLMYIVKRRGKDSLIAEIWPGGVPETPKLPGL